MKNTQNPIVVGNIVFEDTGVSIIRPYMDSDAFAKAVVDNNSDQNELIDRALKCALEFVKARLAHCQAELEANLSKAYAVNEFGIYWKGGHFTLPVFQTMKDLIERNPTSWDDLSMAELQQIVRALHFQRQAKTETWWNNDTLTLAFNVATEFMLCKSYVGSSK